VQQHKQLAEGIITQATAARLRGVSRQRINQLVKDGRLTVAKLPSGEPIEGAVYQDEVLGLEEGKRGRPRLTEDELAARQNHDFKDGEHVIWKHTPRDGYGYSILIPATIDKIGGKRICLTFLTPIASDNERMIKDPVLATDGSGRMCYVETAWVKPDVLLRDLRDEEPVPIGNSETTENGKSSARSELTAWKKTQAMSDQENAWRANNKV